MPTAAAASVIEQVSTNAARKAFFFGTPRFCLRFGLFAGRDFLRGIRGFAIEALLRHRDMSRIHFHAENATPAGAYGADHFRAGSREWHDHVAATRWHDEPGEVLGQLQRFNAWMAIVTALRRRSLRAIEEPGRLSAGLGVKLRAGTLVHKDVSRPPAETFG